MSAKTIALFRLDRMRKWSSFHCSPVPSTNGVSLLGRQYSDSHEICAIRSRSSLFELFDISRLNQSLLLDCTPRNLTSVIPNTDGAVLSMLSLTSSILCSKARETERVVSQQIILKNTQDVNQFAHQRSPTNNNPDRTIFACVLYSIHVQCKNAIG